MVTMKYLCLLTILLLLNCTSKETSRSSAKAGAETQYGILPADNGQQGNDKNELFSDYDYLILDGRPYVDFRGKAYRKYEAHLIDSILCDFSSDNNVKWRSFKGMEQLVNLKYLTIDGKVLDAIDFTPLASLPNLKRITFRGSVDRTFNFESFEQLVNLENLTLYGEGEVFAAVDVTLLASLPKLKTLGFEGNITHLPDLTRLTNLHTVSVAGTFPFMLKSLEGIGAPNVKSIYIRLGNFDSFAPLSNLTHLEELYISLHGTAGKEYSLVDMVNLPNPEFKQQVQRRPDKVF
jgi:Leucine-rich repeat (LRR) protein